MLHERLKQARQLKGLTQEQLAELVHTKKGTISNYENRYSTPSNEMLTSLADILEVSTDYLLGRSGIPKDTYVNEEQIRWIRFGNELIKQGYDLEDIEKMIKNVIATITKI